MNAIKRYIDDPELIEKEADLFIEAVKSLISSEPERLKEILPEMYQKVGKKGKKAVKKAVHLLRTRGVDVRLPENVKGWRLNVSRERKALFSSFDPKGNRMVCGYVEKGMEKYTAFLIIHFLKGIIEPSRGDLVEKNPIPFLKEKWAEEGIEGYELPYEYFVYCIYKAKRRGEVKIVPEFISEDDMREAPSYDPSSLVDLPPLEVDSTRSLIILLREVDKYLPFAVLLPEEMIKEYAEEFERVVKSPLIISRQTQLERTTEFLDKVSEKIFEREIIDAYADFMFDASYIALKKSHIEGARILKWWGTVLRNFTGKPQDMVVLREILFASIERMTRDKEESLIIKP